MTTAVSPRRAQTQDRLLDAAIALFAEKGVHGASVEEICERAGFTRGAFYSNFASKDDLLVAAVERKGEQILRAARQATDSVPGERIEPGSVDEVIRAAMDEIADETDAVFASDDLTACTVLDWAQRSGRTVPDDLRVIGFDGTSAIRAAVPWLTTVQQPIALISRTAVDLLLARINADDATPAPLPTTVELPVTLLEGTTA